MNDSLKSELEATPTPDLINLMEEYCDGARRNMFIHREARSSHVNIELRCTAGARPSVKAKGSSIREAIFALPIWDNNNGPAVS